jgi:TerB N-terminal domain
VVAVADTIGAITIGVLMVAYLVGLPVTLIIAGVSWRSRTRRPQPAPPSVVPSQVGPRPPPQVGPPPTVPALAPSPVSPAFLRLSGLERQVLALRGAPAPADTHYRLASEASELVGRYGSDSTVGRHASGLLAIVEALAPPGFQVTDPPPPPAQVPDRLPDRLRVGLGRLAATGRPVPAAWAYSWLGHLPDRWPARAQHHGDLGRAFTARYLEAHPIGGIVLPATGGRLALSYTPASARFGGQPLVIATGLPDVAGLAEPVHRLRAVAATAAAELPPR